jgi:hypothetical protein
LEFRQVARKFLWDCNVCWIIATNRLLS